MRLHSRGGVCFLSSIQITYGLYHKPFIQYEKDKLPSNFLNSANDYPTDVNWLIDGYDLMLGIQWL